jgi:hypothetical protein
MNIDYKRFLPVILALMLCTSLHPFGRTAFAAPPPPDHDPNGLEMALDALVARPATLVVTLVGTAAFVLTLPFSAPTGNVQEAHRKMMVEPYIYTFKRPLGYTNRDCDASCFE